MSKAPFNLPATMPAQVQSRRWSEYQNAVFDCMATGIGSMVVEAVAGSGKTTTMVEGIKRWQTTHAGRKAVFVAFNKSIAQELATKVPNGCDASTLHSLCYRAIIRRFKGSAKVCDRKISDYTAQVAESTGETDRFVLRGVQEDLTRIYGLLKGTMTDLKDADICAEVLEAYGVQPKYSALSIPLLPQLDKLMRADTSRLTFDEMLSFIPDHNITMPQYDLVCVDEAQDLNLMQIAILKQVVPAHGKLCAVGDSRQAIYMFRGADSQAMNRIRKEFAVPDQNQLPLSITYRCPRQVVEFAQGIVGHIVAASDAKEGAVIHKSPNEWRQTVLAMQPGYLGICRSNAPLISCALQLIKDGRKASVRGRDIGMGLRKLAKDLSKKHDGSVAGLVDALAAFQIREVQRLTAVKKTNQALALTDRCDTLIALLEGMDHLSELDGRIERIFSDETSGIVFSSIHKAKGLEADTVVWLKPELGAYLASKAEERGDKEAATQEMNISYVAITRSKWALICQPFPRPGSSEDDGEGEE